MKTTSWIKYSDRSFSQIKDSLINRLRAAVPELTDFSSSNLLIIIIDMFAGVAEMLNYYIDITARELYLPTARKFSSVLKLAEYAGYLGKASFPAQATLEFSIPGNIAAPINFTIPSGTSFNGGVMNWVLLRDVVFRKGFTRARGFVSQYVFIENSVIGVSDGSTHQMFALPFDYAHDSLDVNVAGVYWNRVNTLGFSSATSKDFIVKLNHDGGIYLVFGDGVNGAIPQDGSNVIINYRATEGPSGMVGPGIISSFVTPPTLPSGVSSLNVTNTSKAFGGRGVEGIEEVRKSVPISMRTLERAVTRQDYIDVAVQAPGVSSAVLNFSCGLGVTLYIIPIGGGTPNEAFLESVEDFIKTKSIVSIPVKALPSGETKINLKATVTGRYRVSSDIITSKVRQALADLYNPFETQINQDIRISDIVSAIDNLPEVDYLTLDYIYATPYLRPNNLALDLKYNIEILNTSNTELDWVLKYTGGSFFLFRGGAQVTSFSTAGTYANVGGVFNFELIEIPSGIAESDYWTFKTYPYNRDIVLTDFTTPVINPSTVIIEAKEQYVRY